MDLLLNHALEVLPAKTAFGLVEPTPGVIWVITVKWAVIPPVLVEVGVTSMEATKENPQHGPILVLLEALVEAGEVTVDVTPWVLLMVVCTVQALVGATKMILLDWMEAGPTAA